MEIYYFILFTTVLYLLYFLLKKINNFMIINSKIQRSLELEKNNVKETEIEKPEKFSSVLNQRKSRLDKIIACKNS